MITRFGGDEFVVLQVGTERYQDAKWLAQRLARTLKDPFDIDGHLSTSAPRSALPWLRWMALTPTNS